MTDKVEFKIVCFADIPSLHKTEPSGDPLLDEIRALKERAWQTSRGPKLDALIRRLEALRAKRLERRRAASGGEGRARARRRRQVERAEELLLGFCNRAAWMLGEPRDPFLRKEAKRHWKKLLRVPTDILKESGERLKARERKWAEESAEVEFGALAKEMGL